MIVIPAIDLRNGRCVRLLQGRKSEVTIYNEDPIAVAKEFAAAGAGMIHVVDLDGAFNEADSPNRAVVKRIVETVDVPVEFGGGIRTLDDVQQLCDAGVARVVLGTLAAESPELLKEFVSRFSSRICVGIDAREGRVMTRGWEAASPVMAVDLARAMAGFGVERIIYTDIARDGMLSCHQASATRRSASFLPPAYREPCGCAGVGDRAGHGRRPHLAAGFGRNPARRAPVCRVPVRRSSSSDPRSLSARARRK